MRLDRSFDGSSRIFISQCAILSLHQKKDTMQKNTKEWIQYGSAIVVLSFAIVLVYISYFTSQRGDVTDNVLWYFAQSLMYAGSIFGVAIAIDAKFENIKNKFLNHKDNEKD